MAIIRGRCFFAIFLSFVLPFFCHFFCHFFVIFFAILLSLFLPFFCHFFFHFFAICLTFFSSLFEGKKNQFSRWKSLKKWSKKWSKKRGKMRQKMTKKKSMINCSQYSHVNWLREQRREEGRETVRGGVTERSLEADGNIPLIEYPSHFFCFTAPTITRKSDRPPVGRGGGGGHSTV